MHRFVEGLTRLYVANVVEVHDVALSKQVSCEATNVAHFNREVPYRLRVHTMRCNCS